VPRVWAKGTAAAHPGGQCSNQIAILLALAVAHWTQGTLKEPRNISRRPVENWRSGGGRACAPVEIRWRPSVCTGRDQAAADRVRRWRSGRRVGMQVRAVCRAPAAFHRSQSRPLTIEQHANAVQQKQLTPCARRPAAASRPVLLQRGSSPPSLQGSGREDEETQQIDDQVRISCMSFRYV